MSYPCYHAIDRLASRRRAISLLEIIVALAVLTGTAAVLAEMVSLAARHAERSQQITQAQSIANNILNELLSGLRDWQSSETFQPVDAWTPWDFQLLIEPLPFGDLVAVTITVAEQRDDLATLDDENLPDQTQITSPRHFRLTRWVARESELVELTELSRQVETPAADEP